MPTTFEIDSSKRYRVLDSGSAGVAWYVTRFVTSRDEDYEWTGIENVDTSRVVCVMVGDDRDFTFDVSDLVELEEGDYCRECGQIGCGHG